MASISITNLLTLPSSGLGIYSTRRFSIKDEVDEVQQTSSPTRSSSARASSSEPPRKVAKLSHSSIGASRADALRGEVKRVRLYLDDVLQPTDSSSSTLLLLKRCLRVLLTRTSDDPLPATYETIYSAARALIIAHKKGQELYDALQIEVEKCVGALASALLASIRPSSRADNAVDVEDDDDAENYEQGVKWLKEFNTSWAWFDKQIALITSLLTYLDRAYIPGNKDKRELLSTTELAKSQFRQRILLNNEISRQLSAVVAKWVTRERTLGEAHEDGREIVKTLTTKLLAVGDYSIIFEADYLRLASQYYLDLSSEALISTTGKNKAKKQEEDIDMAAQADLGAPEAQCYLKAVVSAIDAEDQRTVAVLPLSSRGKMRQIIERAVLVGTAKNGIARAQWFAQDALPSLMNAKDLEQLTGMYHLFHRVDAGEDASVKENLGGKTPLGLLRDSWMSYITKTATEIVQDEKHDDEMIKRLVDLKVFANQIVTDCFVGSGTTPTPFAHALTDGFMRALGTRPAAPARLLALHLDAELRKGQKGQSSQAFLDQLADALELWRFMPDKDVFRKWYARRLSKRLLIGRSASEEMETLVVGVLKQKYDPEFGTFNKMFNDLALSKEMMDEFRVKVIQNERRRMSTSAGDSTIDTRLTESEKNMAELLEPVVLQQSVWPFSPNKKDTINLPPDMAKALVKFTEYYQSKHKGHKLEWTHALGHAVLTARFATGPTKELSVSFFQAVVLLLFNEQTTLAFEDIKAGAGIEDGELRRTLQSLACGPKKILKKQPVGRDVNDGDVFVFNEAFTDPRRNVHINSIQAKETEEETKKTQSAIEGDRKFYLEAAIVRIMKARKEMTYEALKTATIDAVKAHFVPDVSMIKQRISSLVESEYLRRDEDDRQKFHYVA